MSNRQRHRVTAGPTGRIAEREILLARQRRQLDMIANAGLDHLARHEGANTSRKLAPYSAAAETRSLANSRSIALCGKDGLSTLLLACATAPPDRHRARSSSCRHSTRRQLWRMGKCDGPPTPRPSPALRPPLDHPHLRLGRTFIPFQKPPLLKPPRHLHPYPARAEVPPPEPQW